MGRSPFIDVAGLERKPLLFEAVIRPARLDLSHRWTPAKPAHAVGKAELLDREGLRTIRVRGRIRAAVDHTCDRCLEAYRQEFDADFDLFFYPMETIEQGGEAAISRDETEVGFYEGEGIGLAEVVREQLLLWLPMQSLCRPACRGICPACGTNRNRSACSCNQPFTDPRWDGLRNLSYRQ